ncbi:MAG: HNH endonuclease domain-containing protein [Lentimicrobium sp.]|jgi:CRISPR-associated endonuclease Csn1|nr:HNH endonuclease domain-containing protein [Lentimicrobium sp.]
MKKILGLDLGTNSIGWALLNATENGKTLKPESIDAMGSRIIPMDASVLSDFDRGNSKSQTAERTGFRSIRRLNERNLLRRERLHRVLHILSYLPEHYDAQLGWDKSINKTYGKFIESKEPKLAWKEVSTNKYEFIFMDSFNEMLEDFKDHQPELVANGKKVPYDWTIYYLRKKALRSAISKEELAWIILNFNQKRGYYQLRGEEEEENPNKSVDYYALKVVNVERTDDKKGKDYWYNVHLENGWIYRRPSNTFLDWEGKVKEFIVTTDLDDEGNPKLDKEGDIKRSFRAPKEDDWTLLKKKTEADIDQSNKTVGTFIYDALLNKPNQKIRGKLIRTIERKFYRSELKAILEKQKDYHPELSDNELYRQCIEELYPNNISHRRGIEDKSFTYLFVDDIIFYQRPLKSKKSLIANCPFESYSYVDKETGEKKIGPIKCIPKSHPLYQEFRLWQFVLNLRIFQKERLVEQDIEEHVSNGALKTRIKEKLETDVDVTSEFLKNEQDYVALFEWLNDRKEIDQKAFLRYPAFGLKKNASDYRWNYVEDKTYPCNETRSLILNRWEKAGISRESLTAVIEESLWHILYSVKDRHELEKALNSFVSKNGLNGDFTENFKKFPPFKNDYGAYSAKALKKLVPLMRIGDKWTVEAIDQNTRARIEKLINGEFDEKIRNRVREKSIKLTDINHFKGLPVWLASYIVYDRHSEAKDITKWHEPADIDKYLNTFKQHSLRNPIVEKVILETLRTVRDIWHKAGQIDEIHVELGREMKNPADKRARMTKQITENENTNLRIKALLTELINPEFEVDNVRPYSPSQQDILKLYEEYALNSNERYDASLEQFVPDPELPDFVDEIIQKFKENDVKKRPSRSEILRYKLWLEQRYRSPYTGEMIPLGKLFTSAYEIEHIIPQSRYFDDSFSNKVICEAEINKLKDNELGYEFIKNNAGRKVELSFGKTVEVFSIEAYEKFISDNYSRLRGKMKKLLMEEIPDKFIERQLNDSRYISNEVKKLLSNIVRTRDEKGEYEQESVSKNLISVTGSITDRLKKDWGLNDVWNSIVIPRFERLNEVTGTSDFTTTNQNGHPIPAMPLELQKGFSKKRIDHRHHAMDALVVACATRDHVNLLNNEAAMTKSNANRYQLSRKLRRYVKTVVVRNGEQKEIEVAKDFIKPWQSFSYDAHAALSKIIVSFKQNLRVINKTTNKYESYHDSNGKLKIGKNGLPVKQLVAQSKGDSWGIRKPMHAPLPYGERNYSFTVLEISSNLGKRKFIENDEIRDKVEKVIAEHGTIGKAQSYLKKNPLKDTNGNLIKFTVFNVSETRYRKRQPIFKLANRGQGGVKTTEQAINLINKVSDKAIRQALLLYLEENGFELDKAFSVEGIERFNSKRNKPVYKLPIAEASSQKYQIGYQRNKNLKYGEAESNTNLYFAIYWNEAKQKREFETIPLNIAIEHQKLVAHLPKTERTPVPVNKEKGIFLFALSPNDLVYVPTLEELENPSLFDKDRLTADQVKRVYKMVSSSGNQCFFIQDQVASAILNKVEFSALNKMEKTIDSIMVKEICWKLNIDRLGNIVSINNGHR